MYEKIVSAVIPEMDAGFRPMFRDKFYVIVACANWDCGCRTKTGAFCSFRLDDSTGFYLAVDRAVKTWNRRQDTCQEIVDIEMKL